MTGKMKLYIRTDSNEVVATGHLMRCLSIADAMAGRGIESVFITADEKPRALLAERGYRQIVLGTVWDDMPGELTSLTRVLRDEDAKALLIDSYKAGSEYLEALRKIVRTAYIDDLPDPENVRHIPCDILINYSAYAREECYREGYEDTKLLLGMKYVPLRAVFDKPLARTDAGDRVRRTLVLSGGADPQNALGRLAEVLPGEYPHVQFTFVSGLYNSRLEALGKLVEKCENAQLKVQLADLEKYMLASDLTITAGGTTLYELAATRSPAVSYSMADNQMRNVEAFDRLGMIPCGGDIRTDGITGILDTYARLLRSADERAALQQAMIRQMPHGSTGRLADALIREFEEIIRS